MKFAKAVERTITYLPGMHLTGSMKELYNKGKSLCTSDNASLLITGETGTGKELLARSIHYTLSPSSQFIPISCINMPQDHVEKKIDNSLKEIGRDAAAQQDQPAPFAATLYFRDIGKLDTPAQQYLVDLLQEKISTQAGADSCRPGSIKCVFSCSPPDGQAGGGNAPVVRAFNPRLLSILPLRDRTADIRPLANFFIDRFSKEYGKDIGGIDNEAVERLETWPWPGNVSELRDVIENAVLLARLALLTADDIRFNVSKKFIALESFLCREDFFTLEELEKIYIQTVLRRMKNNKSKTARILDISRNTLQSKLENYNALPAKTKARKKSAQQPLF